MERVEDRVHPAGLTPGLGVAVPNNGTLTFHIDNTATGRVDIVRSFGLSSDVPVFGDFLGTTITNVAVYRPSTGVWYLDTANNGTVGKAVRFGGPGWTPVTGDVNGDGRTDLGLYDASTGLWVFSTDLSGNVSIAFGYGGTRGDVPLMADFNHDGVDDPVIYNGGQWLVDTNSDRVPDQVYRMGGAPGATPLIFDFHGTHDPALAVVSRQPSGQLLWAINTNRDGRSIGYYGSASGDGIPFSGYFPTSNSIFVNPATGNDGPGAGPHSSPYRTIGAAVAAAWPGATIRLASGVYRENVQLFSKSNLTFAGTGIRSTIIQPNSLDAVFVYQSTNISFDDLWLYSPGNEGRGIAAMASSINTGLIRTDGTRWIGLLAVSDKGIPSTVNARYSRFDGVATGSGVYLTEGVWGTFYGISASNNGQAAGYRGDAGGLVVGGNSYAKVENSVFNRNRIFGVTSNGTARLEMFGSYIANTTDGCGALLWGASTAVYIGNTFAYSGRISGAAEGMNGIEFGAGFTGYGHLQGNQFIGNTAAGVFINSAPNEIQIMGNLFSGNHWSGISFWGDQPWNSYARIVGNRFEIPADFPVATFGVSGIGSQIHATIGGSGGSANVFDGFRDYMSIAGNNVGGPGNSNLGYPRFTILNNVYRRRGVDIPASRAVYPLT
ncbi:right-handed parallel beta-helix repeat-containing protein [Paludisphaera sp.]|uniref:right-handed parallel beta-helix repeat-containing protein n=1 Tax=Paludisphaera sp. TaxID=2017432 RepID=UPI00301D1235